MADIPTYIDNNFYQESLMHMAVSGVNQFLYFNPWTFGVTMREHELLQSVLEELGDRLGCADRTWLVDPSMRWQDDFVLTGADVHGDAPYRVWRFSPQVPSEFAPTVEKPKPGSAGTMGNVSLPVRLLLSPGSMASCVIRFADAAISQGPSSAFGWWIKQPATSLSPTVNCTGQPTLKAWPLDASL